MLTASQYRTPIRGEIRLKSKQQFIDSLQDFFQDKIVTDQSFFLFFEYKNVRFRLYYNSRFSHINFYAYMSFGWSVSDSIYDYANKDYIEDLGKFLSDKFQCPVALESFNRGCKIRMRFNAGQVWTDSNKIPRTSFPKEDDGFVYQYDYMGTQYKNLIYYDFNKTKSDEVEVNRLVIAC